MLSRIGAFILDIIQVIVFAVAIFLFIYLLVLQPHKIKGSSMEPNFHDGEFLLTDKISYRFGIPKRGDVIVFKAPPDFKEEFIKRIIGLPGDEVYVKEGYYYINNQKLNESYIDAYTNAGAFASEGKSITVPNGQYFVSGDNRGHSFDSRAFGTISRDKITGRAWVLYWPVSEAGVIKKATY